MPMIAPRTVLNFPQYSFSMRVFGVRKDCSSSSKASLLTLTCTILCPFSFNLPRRFFLLGSSFCLIPPLLGPFDSNIVPCFFVPSLPLNVSPELFSSALLFRRFQFEPFFDRDPIVRTAALLFFDFLLPPPPQPLFTWGFLRESTTRLPAIGYMQTFLLEWGDSFLIRPPSCRRTSGDGFFFEDGHTCPWSGCL